MKKRKIAFLVLIFNVKFYPTLLKHVFPVQNGSRNDWKIFETRKYFQIWTRIFAGTYLTY